ncbi:MAG: amidohydrolase [Fimbriiglobus sp.]
MMWVLIAVLALGPVEADAVYLGGKIWTGDPAKPEVEAVAVLGGRVVAIGSTADLLPLVGPKTKVVELKNRRVVPGFYDSHVHWLGGGLQLARVELKDAKDVAEFGARLKKFDESTPRERWMLGGNWDHDRAFGGNLPTAAMVDQYVKNRPVFLQRYDGHMALANTAALKLAKITSATKDPPGGVIERLADGSPSGVFKDAAMELIEKIIPDPSDEEITEAIRAAMQEAAKHGITSVQDMEGSSPAVRRKLFRILQQLAARGELTCRVDVRWPIALQKEITDVGLQANFGNDFVRVGGVKGFMDGSLGSSTAKMFDPYAVAPKNTGVYVTEPDTMRSLVANADRAGLSVAIHAIGDEANARLLDVFSAVSQSNGVRDRRFRIEHAQHLRVEDFQRFSSLKVVASMQPYHVVDDGRWAAGRIGEKRCESSYAFRSLLDAKAVLAFGSDWPVAPLNPFEGLDAAVNRRTLDGKHPNGWFPQQRITVEEALKAYTFGSAYAANQEQERGVIRVGALADFVVLDRDILDAKQGDSLGQAKAMKTIVGGRVVYETKP